MNERYHTSISYPADWIPLQGQLSGDRIVDAFVDPKESQSSVSIVFTPIPADYTRLTSFGLRDTIRSYVLPSGKEVIDTKIIKEVIKGETYTLEYIINAINSPTRHVQSIFALRPQESIIAVTIQTPEKVYETNKEKFDSILHSFKYEL